MDGMLSQEEINALLNGIGSDGDTESAPAQASADGEELLSPMQKDAMGEIANISMGTAATTLSSLVNQKVDITTPKVEFSDWETLVDQYDRPCVFIQLSYKEGINGDNVLILKDTDVKIIADLMMGGDGKNISGELGELQLSAICEAMNQMMGSSSTSLSTMIRTKIDISPPKAYVVNLNEALDIDDLSSFAKGEFVKISFKMTIGDLVDSEIMQLYPSDFCELLCTKFGVGDTDAASASEPAPEPQPIPDPEPIPNPEPIPAPQPVQNQTAATQMPQMEAPQMQPQGAVNYAMPQMAMPQGAVNYAMPQMMPQANLNVQQAQFQTFSPDILAVNQKENIDLIMDVPLEVTVELGRTKKSIQDILEFAPGTIIELNKIAGEPIDVLVNGKYVAKGEVVVIEENFGVRVTEIIHE